MHQFKTKSHTQMYKSKLHTSTILYNKSNTQDKLVHMIFHGIILHIRYTVYVYIENSCSCSGLICICIHKYITLYSTWKLFIVQRYKSNKHFHHKIYLIKKSSNIMHMWLRIGCPNSSCCNISGMSFKVFKSIYKIIISLTLLNQMLITNAIKHIYEGELSDCTLKTYCTEK